MSLKLFCFFLFITYLYGSEPLIYSEQAPYKIGLFGHINYNNYNSNFTKLPDIPNCCPKFTTGGGFGYKIGLLFETDKSFWSLRSGLNNLSGGFIYTEKTNVIPNGTSVEGEFEHTIDADLNAIFLQPFFNLYINDNLLINLGVDFSYLITTEFSQKEQISKPVGQGTFLDSLGNDTYSRIRNQFSGKIPDANDILFSLTFGISYNLPMNKSNSLWLSPEAYFSYGINNVVKSIDWNINTFSLGLAIKYKKPSEIIYKDEFEEIYKIDTLILANQNVKSNTIVLGFEQQEKLFNIDASTRLTTTIFSRTDTLFLPRAYQLQVDVNAVGIDTNDISINKPRVVLEEFVSKRLDPLLNYIFFEDSSSIIPARYKLMGDSEVLNFSEDKLYADSTLAIYYNLLNIVGNRLKNNPSAKLTIIGCNSNSGAEKGNLELSKQRAEKVKNYLVDNWFIEHNRLLIQTRNLPAKASLPYEEPDKIAENRRVELVSDNYEILKPVFTTDTALFCNLEKIKFVPEINSEAGLKEYEISAMIDKEGDFLKKTGNIIKDEIVELNSFYKKINATLKPISYSIKAIDIKEQQAKSTIKQIPIEIISLEKKSLSDAADFEINKFSLILFEFDRSDIAGNNKTIVDFIKNIAKPDSEIEIVGFTDRTGNDDYNFKLSERRASATKTTLGINNANARGAGETILIYNNDIPEGRFYCRTVEILVKTRVK